MVQQDVPRHLFTAARPRPTAVYTSTRGHSRTMGNFIFAAYYALAKLYAYLSPDLWKETHFLRTPYEEHSAFLAKAAVAKAY